MRRRTPACDVLVQGAGLTGLTAAVALARRGLAATVVDQRLPGDWSGGDYRLRVVSLNRGSEAALRRLGAWNRLPGWRAAAVRGIEAADGHDGPVVTFDAADAGEPHLAHIVENDLALAALMDVARSAGVQFREPAAVADWATTDDGLSVRLTDGSEVAAGLLLGADGADSAIREHAGIGVTASDYGQQGVVATVTGHEHHGAVARQRFLPGGPMALLPLPDGRCSLVWSLPRTEADELMQADDAAFRDALDAAAGGWLGGVRAVGERARFPLRRLHAERYIADRVALLGDAAHVIHPLAGQGANLGIADAVTLARLLGDSVERGRDPGGRAPLRRFERARRGENALMQLAMDAFHHGFTSDSAVLRGLRRTGFRATARLPLARRLFMRQAMGSE